MRIKLLIEKSGKKSSIDFTEREIRDLYDWIYLCDDECKYCTHNKRLNKIKISSVFYKKFMHFIHDIMDEGRVSVSKDGELSLSKKKSYMIKKPTWMKIS